MFDKIFTRKILLNWLYTKYLRQRLQVKCFRKCMKDENQVFASVVRINIVVVKFIVKNLKKKKKYTSYP